MNHTLRDLENAARTYAMRESQYADAASQCVNTNTPSTARATRDQIGEELDAAHVRLTDAAQCFVEANPDYPRNNLNERKVTR